MRQGLDGSKSKKRGARSWQAHGCNSPGSRVAETSWRSVAHGSHSATSKPVSHQSRLLDAAAQPALNHSCIITSSKRATQSLSLTCAAASPSTVYYCSARACLCPCHRVLEGCRSDIRCWVVWQWSVAQAGHNACLCSAGLLRSILCTPGGLRLPRCFWRWRVAQAGHSACLVGGGLLQGVPFTPGSP